MEIHCWKAVISWLGNTSRKNALRRMLSMCLSQKSFAILQHMSPGTGWWTRLACRDFNSDHAFSMPFLGHSVLESHRTFSRKGEDSWALCVFCTLPSFKPFGLTVFTTQLKYYPWRKQKLMATVILMSIVNLFINANIQGVCIYPLSNTTEVIKFNLHFKTNIS